jgi:hippurate hydrolase
VVLMFQPGEEGCDGAGLMLQEGVLGAAGRPVRSAYGMHVFSSRFPRGTFTTRPGTLMAASDALFVTVRGRGGHGSAPHLGRDPVAAAAGMGTSRHNMVARPSSIVGADVVAVAALHAGTRYNVIPDEALFQATVRSFSSESRGQMRQLAPELCRSIGAAHGVEVDVEFHEEYPVTVNDAAHADFVQEVVRDVFGEERSALMPDPIAGAEDFSRVLEAVPGCYLFLGAHVGESLEGADNHSPRAMFDDSVLSDGSLLHAQLAMRALRRDSVPA